MNTTINNILIIGSSDVGKTHFGGQLYGRLDERNCSLTFRERPDNLSIFKEVWDKLNDGLLGSHTPVNQNTKIIFPVKDSNERVIDIIYPDYAGEQIRQIVEQRNINIKWIELIQNCDDWILFIRPQLIDPIVDITTKFYDHIKNNKEKEELENNTIGIKDNNPVFYIELLQMFLYIKGISKISNNKTCLTILLSCWDEIKNQDEPTTPRQYFDEKMPMLSNFISTIWKNNHRVCGLSSLGQSLNDKEPDAKFASEGPENKGYFIEEEGLEEIRDLTLIFSKK